MAEPRRWCTAQTVGGGSCAARPQRERLFCFVHDPEQSEAASEARKLGGLRRRREGTLGVVYDLETLDQPAGIRRLLDIVVADTLGFDTGVPRSRVLIAVAEVATRLLGVADNETRISALETALAPAHRRTAAPVRTDEELAR